MPEETIKNVKMNMTGDKNWTMDYKKSDVDQLIDDYIGKHHDWPKSWRELMGFDEKHGEAEWHITPGEAVAMKEDMQEAISHNVPFTHDRQKLYHDMHQYRHLHPNQPEKAKEEMHALHHQGHPDSASGPSGNR